MRLLRRASPRAYLVASGVFALATGLVLHAYVSGVANASTSVGPRIPVVVAERAVSRGARLAASDLRTVQMPAAYAPPGSIRTISAAAGRVTLTDLVPREAVTTTRLARVRAGPVASLIPEGLRAFAVPSTLPPGSIAAGDHVDVLATFSGGQPHTETVVTGVEVLTVLGTSGLGQASGSGGSGQLGMDGGPAADAAAAGIGVGSATLVVLVGLDQEQRLAYARAFADLEVVIAPAETP